MTPPLHLPYKGGAGVGSLTLSLQLICYQYYIAVGFLVSVVAGYFHHSCHGRICITFAVAGCQSLRQCRKNLASIGRVLFITHVVIDVATYVQCMPVHSPHIAQMLCLVKGSLIMELLQPL